MMIIGFHDNKKFKLIEKIFPIPQLNLPTA